MIKYAVFILDKRRSTLYAMHDEIELLVVVMDSTAPEEMIEEMLREFRFVRRVNVTKLLEKVEKKLFPQLERGRIGFLTQIQLSIAMRKAEYRTTGFIQDVGEKTRVIVIAPPYIDRMSLGLNLTMTCKRHITALGQN